MLPSLTYPFIALSSKQKLARTTIGLFTVGIFGSFLWFQIPIIFLYFFLSFSSMVAMKRWEWKRKEKKIMGIMRMAQKCQLWTTLLNVFDTDMRLYYLIFSLKLCKKYMFRIEYDSLVNWTTVWIFFLVAVYLYFRDTMWLLIFFFSLLFFNHLKPVLINFNYNNYTVIYQ